MNLRHLGAAAAVTIALAVPPLSPTPANAAVAPNVVLTTVYKYKFKNCTAMNKVYPHGVGKVGARDHTSGQRVTTFKKSTSLYKKIIAYRSGLDRDKDGIACEKR
ncbi:MAG: excalibur calcium-binding domain-containing protein [Propionicimonas sp.]